MGVITFWGRIVPHDKTRGGVSQQIRSRRQIGEGLGILPVAEGRQCKSKSQLAVNESRAGGAIPPPLEFYDGSMHLFCDVGAMC
jgi:hypothetical protein